MGGTLTNIFERKYFFRKKKTTRKEEGGGQPVWKLGDPCLTFGGEAGEESKINGCVGGQPTFLIPSFGTVAKGDEKERSIGMGFGHPRGKKENVSSG